MIRVERMRLRAEFDAKYNLYFELIGSLYPSTVYNQLCQLRKELIEVGATDLPQIPPPNYPGYAPNKPSTSLG